MRTLVLLVALVCTTNVAVAEPRSRPLAGVRIASSSDASPGVLDAHARRRHGEIVRRVLHDVLHRSGITLRHAGTGDRQIDVAIVAWRIARTSTEIAISAELRVVVCDGRGRILSMVTGRAKMSAPAHAVRLAELREHVLSEAVIGMGRSLQAQLAPATS